MHYVTVNKTDAIYMVCGRNNFDACSYTTSSRPGLFLSARPEFLERGEVFNKKFPEVAPQKNVSAYFSPDYYTAPVLSLKS